MILNEMECDIPLTSLQAASRKVLSSLLNPIKYIPTENVLFRDWRGLAQLTDTENNIQSINSSPDQTAKVLSLWSRKSPMPNLHDLLTNLEKLERFDIIDDTKELFEQDIKTFRDNNNQTIVRLLEASSRQENTLPEPNKLHLLTVDDQHWAEIGSSKLQYYDASVLFVDEDIVFATKLIKEMENKGFKLFVKDRDLLGGHNLEHTAVLSVLTERCARIIVIMSDAFLQSPANTFFMNHAQAHGIEQKERKVVPCLYKSCTLPPQLSYYYYLNYQRSSPLYNFWDKLEDSLRTPSALTDKQRATVREIKAESSLATLTPYQDLTRNIQPNQSFVDVPENKSSSENGQQSMNSDLESNNLRKHSHSASMLQINNINSLSVPTSSFKNKSDSEVENVDQTPSNATGSSTFKKFLKTTCWYKNDFKPSSPYTSLTDLTNSKSKKMFKTIKKKITLKGSPAT